eukprot:5348041-Pleurochrysis_carterae.AAC.5
MQSSYRRRFKPGEAVFQQGDAVTGFYIIIAGELSVQARSERQLLGRGATAFAAELAAHACVAPLCHINSTHVVLPPFLRVTRCSFKRRPARRRVRSLERGSCLSQNAAPWTLCFLRRGSCRLPAQCGCFLALGHSSSELIGARAGRRCHPFARAFAACACGCDAALSRRERQRGPAETLRVCFAQGRESRNTTVRCITPAEVLMIDKSMFLKLAAAPEGTAANKLAGKIRQAETRRRWNARTYRAKLLSTTCPRGSHFTSWV